MDYPRILEITKIAHSNRGNPLCEVLFEMIKEYCDLVAKRNLQNIWAQFEMIEGQEGENYLHYRYGDAPFAVRPAEISDLILMDYPMKKPEAKKKVHRPKRLVLESNKFTSLYECKKCGFTVNLPDSRYLDICPDCGCKKWTEKKI